MMAIFPPGGLDAFVQTGLDLAAWLAGPLDDARRSRTLLESAALAERSDRETFLVTCALAAQARRRGELLLPALRTAESLILHAAGATCTDPIELRMASYWPTIADSSPSLVWYSGRQHPGIPTAPCWQLAAAERLWPRLSSEQLERITAADCALVLQWWQTLMPQCMEPQLQPRTALELAAVLALACPADAVAPRWTAWSAMQTLQPSRDPTFADSFGWPVFSDDVLLWLGQRLADDPPNLHGRLKQLRVSQLGARAHGLRGIEQAEDPAPQVLATGPLLLPRSVALAQAQLAVVGARCLAQDRRLSLTMRQSFEEVALGPGQ